jgi:hypothetical protein
VPAQISDHGERVRVNRKGGFVSQLRSDVIGCRAVVDEKDMPGLDFSGSRAADRLLESEIVGDLFVVFGLQRSATGSQAAAVGADDERLAGKLLEVPPDRQGGDAEHLREFVDPKFYLHGAKTRYDFTAPLLGLHKMNDMIKIESCQVNY